MTWQVICLTQEMTWLYDFATVMWDLDVKREWDRSHNACTQVRWVYRYAISTVIDWFAHLLHSAEMQVSNPALVFLCGVCMFPPCMCGFSPGDPGFLPALIECSKLSLSLIVSVNGYLSMWAKPIGWQPNQDVPRLLPDDSWYRLQHIRDHHEKKRGVIIVVTLVPASFQTRPCLNHCQSQNCTTIETVN